MKVELGEFTACAEPSALQSLETVAARRHDEVPVINTGRI
jgi:hypothetical protein